MNDGPQASTTRSPHPTTNDLVARLLEVNGDPALFLARLVQVQCEMAGADSGAVLSVQSAQHVRVLALHPAPEARKAAPAWLARSAEVAARVVGSRVSEVVALPTEGETVNGTNGRKLIVIPLQGTAGSQEVAAFVVPVDDSTKIERVTERLELSAAFVNLYEMRVAMQTRTADLGRMRSAMEVLDAINEHSRMKAVSIAFCNEIAARWDAERVTLGFLKGQYVKTVAISHTEKYDRKMTLVQDIESTMEECLDQDVEVLHPAPSESPTVNRAAGELAARHGPASIVSLPLRQEGKPVAVVTVERPVEHPLTTSEIETLRLTCNLCTARLVDLHQNDKWIGAKAVDSARHGLASLVGPEHTWAKVVALAIFACALFLLIARGADRVDASFEIQTLQRRLVPAPFDGILQTVTVKPGDRVEKGQTVLATLETADLQLTLAAATAERAGYIKEADLALRDGKTAELQIAEANMRRIEAERRLLAHRISQAALVAPISGTVVVGDLERQLGAPVETGTVLFEIAPLDAFRAELDIPEDRISDVVETRDGKPGMRGTMASVSHPGDYIPFEVERINPIAEVVDQQNVFKVRVRLEEERDWLRPGMKGIAKVDAGRRSYGYLWTRKFVNWARMKLWI